MSGGDPEKLEAVARHRQTFRPLLQTLMAPVFASLPREGLVVEIGAGDGQFTSLFPPAVRARTVATEPGAYGRAELRRKLPDLDIREAEAHQLPFADGEVSAIVASCVFDVLPHLSAAISEFRRVLRPGGHVLHVLDMSADLLALVTEVVEAGGLCLLPNVFTNPTAAAWPEDLLVIPSGQLDLIVRVLGADPAADRLRPYQQAFRASGGEAFAAFAALHESAQGRSQLAQAFRRASALASEPEKTRLRAFEGKSLSSARVFHEQVLAADWEGFSVLQADIARTQSSRETGALGPDDGYRAVRSIVGFAQSGAFAGPTAPGRQVLELGVHIFRAVKTP